MTPANYSEPEVQHKLPAPGTKRGELVTIPDAHAVGETLKALRCEFGDDADHWVPKSQIAPQSEVKRRGDRGRLVVPKWWAVRAGVGAFAQQPSPWARLRHTRHRLQEIDMFLAKDDPARAIVKTICDALRENLGVEHPVQTARAPTGGLANSTGEGGGSGINKQ